MAISLLAVDPGVDTGWAMRNVDEGWVTGVIGPHRGWADEWRTADALMELANRCEYVVFEDFILYDGHAKNSDRDGLSPVRVTAAFFTLVQERGRKFNILPFQMASEVMTTLSDQRLASLDYEVRGKTDHEKDALRHLIMAERKMARKARARR